MILQPEQLFLKLVQVPKTGQGRALQQGRDLLYWEKRNHVCQQIQAA